MIFSIWTYNFFIVEFLDIYLTILYNSLFKILIDNYILKKSGLLKLLNDNAKKKIIFSACFGCFHSTCLNFQMLYPPNYLFCNIYWYVKTRWELFLIGILNKTNGIGVLCLGG